MLKTISKVGKSQMLIFDTALRDLTGLRAGDLVDVTIHKDGALKLTPVRRPAGSKVVSATAKR